MATDGLAPAALGRVNAAGVPVAALVLGGLWSAVLADLHRRCGHAELATQYRDAALAAASRARP